LVISQVLSDLSLPLRTSWSALNSSPPTNILWRVCVTVDGVWICNQIYCTLTHPTRDYTLQITVTHRQMFSVTICIAPLGSGFQLQTFPFLWVPELSPDSATSFCNSQSKSELLYNGRFTADQFALAPWGSRPEIYLFATEPLRA
jgi:hypothetical protein